LLGKNESLVIDKQLIFSRNFWWGRVLRIPPLPQRKAVHHLVDGFFLFVGIGRELTLVSICAKKPRSDVGGLLFVARLHQNGIMK